MGLFWCTVDSGLGRCSNYVLTVGVLSKRCVEEDTAAAAVARLGSSLVFS